MNPRALMAAGLGLSITAFSCGALPDDIDAQQSANRTGENDQGTRLSPTGQPGAVMCMGGGVGVIVLTGTLVSSAAADSAVITASVDGGAEVQVGIIQPQDFSRGGREKSAPYSVRVAPGGGMHTVVLCFTQSGSQGRYPKRTCTPPATYVVNCDQIPQPLP